MKRLDLHLANRPIRVENGEAITPQDQKTDASANFPFNPAYLPLTDYS